MNNNQEPLNINAILSSSLFSEIDKIVTKSYKEIGDIEEIRKSKISINNSYLINSNWLTLIKELESLIKKSEFPESQKSVILSSTIIDIHVRFCEERKLDVLKFAYSISEECYQKLLTSIQNSPFKDS